jgi:hypothetical protein
MKIELKSLKINKSFSEETICFTADIYANGKKVGYAKNDGHGGCTDYHHYEKTRDLLKEVEEHCKTLPPQSYVYNGETKEYDTTLEHVIDNLVTDKFNSDEAKAVERKLLKKCETHICWGVPNSGNYHMIGFKGSPKLADMLRNPIHQKLVSNLYLRIKKEELKEGEVILNKNLPWIS